MALHNEDFFLHKKTIRNPNGRYTAVLQTNGLVANKAVEMHMVVMMVTMIAGSTYGILCLKLLIRNPVKNSGIQKLLQTAINGGPVDLTGESLLKIRMRQRRGFFQESLENFYPLTGLPEIETL
jgi:hypothetical protein